MSTSVIVITHLYSATLQRCSSPNNTKPNQTEHFSNAYRKETEKNQGTQGTFNNLSMFSQQITNFLNIFLAEINITSQLYMDEIDFQSHIRYAVTHNELKLIKNISGPRSAATLNHKVHKVKSKILDSWKRNKQ